MTLLLMKAKSSIVPRWETVSQMGETFPTLTSALHPHLDLYYAMDPGILLSITVED